MYCFVLLSSPFLIFLNNKTRAITGKVTTHTISVGTARAKHRRRCLEEKHSMSVSILIILTPSSISTHRNMAKLCSVHLGCRRNMILMNEITMFRLRSLIHFRFNRYTASQRSVTIMKRINGRKKSKNCLNKAVDSKGPLI